MTCPRGLIPAKFLLVVAAALLVGCHLIYPFAVDEQTNPTLDALADQPRPPSDADAGAGRDSNTDGPLPPKTGFCSAATGWCWLRPQPQGNNLTGVWAYDGSRAFAVGWAGTIMHYDGKMWSRQISGVSIRTKLHAVWGASASDVFAVGEDENNQGIVLHYDGVSWSKATISGSKRIRSVWGTTGANVYATAEGGHVLRYDGKNWNTEHHDGSINWAIAVWTIGDQVFAGWGGNILHKAGASASWVVKPLKSCTTVTSLWGASATSVYALCALGQIHRYDGQEWALEGTLTTQTMYGLGASGAGHRFAVGLNGAIHRRPYSTAPWKLETTPTTNALRSISATGSRIFVVGDGGVLLWSSNGSSWTEQSSGTSKGQIFSFLGPSSTDLAAVDGESKLWHFNGSSWSDKGQVVTPAVQLYALWGPSTSDLFTGGQGWHIYRSSKGGWPISHTGSGGKWDHVKAIWGRAGNDVFATGSGGVIKHFDGLAWSQAHVVPGMELKSLWSDKTNIFAAGLGGVVHHQEQGGKWTADKLPTAASINALWGSDGDNVYAVGTGAAARFNGVEWKEMPLPAEVKGASLLSLCGTSATELYAGGATGELLRHSGGSWQAIPHGLTDRSFRALWCEPAPGGKAAVFAGGPNGMVLYLRQ
jgi:hypothetical protein